MKQRCKEIVDFHINEETITESSHPVDYSFFKFQELKPVECEIARITRLGDTPERGKEKKKYLTKGVWLNNNRLTSIIGMDKLVEAVLEYPQKLSWIDFSYNYIKKIDQIILQFPNLAIVNFHGNKIEDITEVAKLNALKKLRNITFHGNPIAMIDNYRSVIIAYLPTIVHLDFQPVLKSERRAPPPPNTLKYVKQLDALKQKAKEDGAQDIKKAAQGCAEKLKERIGKAKDKPKEAEQELNDQTRKFKTDGLRPQPQVYRQFARKGQCTCLQNRPLLNPQLG